MYLACSNWSKCLVHAWIAVIYIFPFVEPFYKIVYNQDIDGQCEFAQFHLHHQLWA